MSKQLCAYGCGQEAVKQLDNGKWICSEKWQQCPEIRKRKSQIKLKKSPYYQLRKNVRQNKAKCYICGNKAKYFLKSVKKPCCKKLAYECSGYSEYIGDRMIEEYANGIRTPNWEGKGTRPNHAKKLLKLNKFGTLGGTNVWHKKARELFHTGHCEICGKTEKEQLKEMNKGLHMHCLDENYTNLNPNNWKTLCHTHHRWIHSKDYKEVKNG